MRHKCAYTAIDRTTREPPNKQMEISIQIETSPRATAIAAAQNTTTHVLDRHGNGYPETKRKHKMKAITKPVSLEKPLGLLALTAREKEVLTWIAQGKTNYEIGVILTACTGTICKHVERILRKLCVENRTSAAAIVLAALGNPKI